MNLACPRCTETVKFDPDKAGQTVICEWCNQKLRMPTFAELSPENQDEYRRELLAAQRKAERKAEQERRKAYKAEQRKKIAGQQEAKAERLAEAERAVEERRARVMSSEVPPAKLMLCPDCERPVSRKAESCAGCGRIICGRQVADLPPSSQALPALASFFIPGLGQLIQGRVCNALAGFVIVGFFGVITMALVMSGMLGAAVVYPITLIMVVLDAAKYVPPKPGERRRMKDW